eukprot:CAMPEP_0119261220 /NCGR_PEP_ID=MMETSP1329-20130426/1354_1 /TAXON_ID=114041 /ORGANISM="Genus nov. species nov., Strain RCC1024" /LENGTH=185 /DNA_ID=CAMNT_0007260741 /DNA_START=209 /DNA_END=763 /DNA_ORIENTATION=+
MLRMSIFALAATARALRHSAPARVAPKTTRAAASAATDAATATAETNPFTPKDSRPIVLYDGVCRMCNFWVDFVLANDPYPGKLRFAALQSSVGKALLQRAGREPDDISSIVLASADGSALLKSEAVLEIGRQLAVTTPLSAIGSAVPRAIADAAYDAVADNRYNVAGKRPYRDNDERNADRFLG